MDIASLKISRNAQLVRKQCLQQVSLCLKSSCCENTLSKCRKVMTISRMGYVLSDTPAVKRKNHQMSFKNLTLFIVKKTISTQWRYFTLKRYSILLSIADDWINLSLPTYKEGMRTMAWQHRIFARGGSTSGARQAPVLPRWANDA